MSLPGKGNHAETAVDKAPDYFRGRHGFRKTNKNGGFRHGGH